MKDSRERQSAVCGAISGGMASAFSERSSTYEYRRGGMGANAPYTIRYVISETRYALRMLLFMKEWLI